MKTPKLSLALLVVLSLSSLAFSQGSLYQDRAEGRVQFSPYGNALVALPGASVTVCTDSTCATPVTLYSNEALTLPFLSPGNVAFADLNGNFSFYTFPGIYWCTVRANGFAPLSRACQVSTTSPSVTSFAQNLSFSGNNSHTGIETFDKLNGIFFGAGNSYPCTATGTIALLAAATGQANTEGCLNGFTSTSEIDIGSAIKSGISLIHPSTSTWTINFNNSSACGVKIFDGTSFTGRGSAASSNGAFTLTFPGSANLAAGLCTNLTGANYTAAENIRLYSPNGATFTNGLFDVENNVDSSWFRNITVANYSGVGVFWWDNCCSASTYNLVSNGNYGANAIPFWLKSDVTHNNVASYFYATSLGHPGAGKNNLLLTGLNRYWCNGHGFYGLYLEGASGVGDTATAAIDDNCYGGTSFYDVTMASDDPASTRFLLQIESGVGGVNALNIESGISTNIINDIANGITVTTAAGGFPGYQPINYMSIPTWMPFLHIGGVTGGPGGIYNRNLLFSASQPTLGTGFGTAPSMLTNNGATAFSINVGTGGTATTGVINFNNTAQNRWNVHCDDRTTYTTAVFKTRQTASTTTSATIGNFNSSAAAAAWASGDIIDCIAAAE